MKKNYKKRIAEELYKNIDILLPQTTSAKEPQENIDPFKEKEDFFIKKTTFRAVKYVGE